MSLDAIQRIGVSEQAAQQSIIDAQTKARALIAQAHSTAEIDYEAQLKAAAQQSSHLIAEAKERALAVTSRQREIALTECEVLRQDAVTRLNAAVSIVVEKVVTG